MTTTRPHPKLHVARWLRDHVRNSAYPGWTKADAVEHYRKVCREVAREQRPAPTPTRRMRASRVSS